MANIIFIDNFDSFTYNLVDQFRALGHHVQIYRNTVSIEQIDAVTRAVEQPLLVLSPGPGTPAAAGNMPAMIQYFKGQIPMLGICLGHQAIVEAYGGKVDNAEAIVHGKVSHIRHQGHAVFAGLASPLAVARYHSLVATEVPSALSVLATVDEMVMAVSHEAHKVCGFQFHPESIMTTQGATLLTNAVNWTLQSHVKTQTA